MQRGNEQNERLELKVQIKIPFQKDNERIINKVYTDVLLSDNLGYLVKGMAASYVDLAGGKIVQNTSSSFETAPAQTELSPISETKRSEATSWVP